VDLRSVALFEDLEDADIAMLESCAEEVHLQPGEILFYEGDAGNAAYVIEEGELEILTDDEGREVLLAVRRAGDVIGEMSLLEGLPRTATVRAGGPTRVVGIPKHAIDLLMANSPTAVISFFNVLVARWRQTRMVLAQNERMAQLGTLTAGVAHELNNPTAAVGRAAGQLREAINDAISAERRLHGAGVDREAIDEVLAAATATERPTYSALQRSDLEAEVEDLLTDVGHPSPWNVAPAVVESGLATSLAELVEAAGSDVVDLLELLRTANDMATLLYEIEEGSRRVSDIVRVLKSYSYLDQAPVQDVDVAGGIDDTLLLLRSKLKDVKVETDFPADLPRIEGYGAELNQVWTNLIDNAAYAVSEVEDPRICVRAHADDDTFHVEVEDNGPGIAPEDIPKLYDAFFTTKPPGSGTGLGLNISYQIVAHRHRGNMTVESQPGRTVFAVDLPIRKG
jgi:signal transduction histidine kinase